MHIEADEIPVSPKKMLLSLYWIRFIKVKKSKRIGDLVEFQAMNKYILMVHNQEELKILGNSSCKSQKNSII